MTGSPKSAYLPPAGFPTSVRRWLPRRDPDGTPRLELRPFGRLRREDRDALEGEAARLLPVLRDGAFSRYPGTD